MTYGRDTHIGSPSLMHSPHHDDENAEQITEAINKLLGVIVSCPDEPVMITGITAADAFDAGDVMGNFTKVKVPKLGIIYSATFWDLDDEGTQVDLELFKHVITQTASDAAWSPTDADMLGFVTEIPFVSFDDHINSQTAEVNNIGKAYTAPEGFLWVQAVCRGTPNIAAGSSPRFQLQIISYDPTWRG